MALMFGAFSKAQSIDFSVFGIHQVWSKKDIMLSWAMYQKNKFSLQTRLNFDAPGTVSIIPGYVIKTKKFTIVPEFGVLYGDYKSLSTEYYGYGAFGKNKRTELYVFGQHSWALRNNISFGYTYNQILWPVDMKRNFRIGLAGQYLTQTFIKNRFEFLDIGPQFKINFFGNYYLKIWPTRDPLNNRSKVITGVGINLSK